MKINYQKANNNDLDKIYELIKKSIIKMEENNIFQWDDSYPTKDDFKIDIDNNNLYIGKILNKIVVIFVIDKNCDEEYINGKWEYANLNYYVIHRLCVNPVYQNMKIAKNTLIFIENEIKKLNGNVVRLDVFSKNPYALKLYNKAGYKNVGTVTFEKGKFYLMEKYFINEN